MGVGVVAESVAFPSRQVQDVERSSGGQEGYHPKASAGDEMMLRKLTYLHHNPVERGDVIEPAHWRYSSAHEWLLGSQPKLRCDAWR